MDKKYIDRKIKNCKKLIETATSEDQKKIYQGYLEIWKNNKGFIQKGKTITPEWQDFDELKTSEEFEIVFPNKKAYYSRNGELLKTKAFKEFLNQ